MAVIQNSIAKEPSDDKVIWKFLTLPKFLDLIQRKKMFFCQVEKLDDPWEGVNNAKAFEPEYWKRVNEYLDDELKIKCAITEDMENFKAAMDIWRSRSYVDCWHTNNFEPEGFWKLYSDREYGLAIKTSVKKLRKSLEVESRSLLLGEVQYIDYMNQDKPKGNPLAPMFYKRKSFEFENEVRVLSWTNEENRLQGAEIHKKGGVHIDIDLHTLIDKLWIAPNSPGWFVDIIYELVQKYELGAIPIEKSSLNLPPKYLNGFKNYKFVE